VIHTFGCMHIHSSSIQIPWNYMGNVLCSITINFIDNEICLLWSMQINGSLARRAIRDLMAKGLIRLVSAHSSQQIYTRATNT